MQWWSAQLCRRLRIITYQFIRLAGLTGFDQLKSFSAFTDFFACWKASATPMYCKAGMKSMTEEIERP